MHIIYRATNIETTPETYRSFRPKWFDKRKCFKSLVDNVSENDNVIVLFDGEQGILSDYIKTFKNISFINIDVRSNVKSLLACYDLINTLPEDSVYFLEDDYLHTSNSLNVLKEGIEKFKLVTLYDHNDRYTGNDDITSGKDFIQITKSCHWRTAESTTCTWACSKDILKKIVEIAKQYKLEDRALFRYLYTMNIRLWTPIIGKSTHVCDGYMSPFTDWKTINESVVL